MNISYNWLREYADISLSPEQIAEVLTAIGLEVESIESIEPVPGGLKGVVVGEVLTCEKHPDADRLRITTVNLGSGEPVQIVCGAPNVAAGQKVLVATVGTTLYPNSGEPFAIKKSKIRGAESNGMICAEDELGLGTGHDGIMVLDAALTPGTPAGEALQLKTDYQFSIGLTPNRTDAFSHIGVARDLCAALQHMEGREPGSALMRIPDVSQITTGKALSPITVEVKDAIAAPRYAGLYIDDVTIGPSPAWLQERLAAIGLRPINVVVDITNYVQHECGQPLHAFDADRIAGGKVIVRRAVSGEPFTTLDGVKRTLHEDDLVIADAEKPMCLAGIFGGQDSGVGDSTTRIFLESAWFNGSVVRKTARRHVLNTDSSFRFERGTDPSQVIWALSRAAQLIVELAGGTLPAQWSDFYPQPATPAEVTLRYSRAEMLIGKAIPAQNIRRIAEALGFEVKSETAEALVLHVPHYRVEVTREVDVIEEILRIYGYDNIGFPKGMRSVLAPVPSPDAEKVYERIANLLAAQGFSEIMNMSMTRSKYAALTELPEYSEASVVKLLNPLSSDLGIMRQTLLWGGMQTIALNQNHRSTDLRLFELGKEYRTADNGFSEKYKLMLLMTGRRNRESWNTSKDPVSFADIRAALEGILRACGLKGWKAGSTEYPFLSEGMEWSRGKDVIARAGKVSAEILSEFDVKADVWMADIEWEVLLRALPAGEIIYKAPEKFPAVRRDLSLLLDRKVTFAEVESVATSVDRKILREVNLFDVYEGKNLEVGKKSYAVSFILQDATKTMTDQQVDGIMEQIRKSLESKLGAALRG
jgi:phenylalanyl-tRNA synthetase beta chain